MQYQIIMSNSVVMIQGCNKEANNNVGNILRGCVHAATP